MYSISQAIEEDYRSHCFWRMGREWAVAVAAAVAVVAAVVAGLAKHSTGDGPVASRRKRWMEASREDT